MQVMCNSNTWSSEHKLSESNSPYYSLHQAPLGFAPVHSSAAARCLPCQQLLLTCALLLGIHYKQDKL